MKNQPGSTEKRARLLTRRRLLLLLLPVVIILAGVGAFLAMRPTIPAGCSAVAHDDHGTVSAAFTSTVGAIKKLHAVAGSPQLDGYASDQTATICYIDGEIAKGPPPEPNGTIPPSFDRVVIVVVGQDTILVSAGYSQDLPIQAP